MKFDVMLDVNSPTFIDELKSALGLHDGDSIELVTPQFTRTDGRVITYYPKTAEEFDALHKLSDDALRAIGCGLWGDGHWLYPGEWYWNIPTGYQVVDINNAVEEFVPGKTDDDIRFGCLAYGFKKS